METTDMETLRYPIGRYKPAPYYSEADIANFTNHIAELPARLRNAVQGLTDVQLDTPYRQGGWTVRQVVHHLADSHINSYTRFRMALTEDLPNIKTYEEMGWAELPDAKKGPVKLSLDLLEALHTRWVIMLRGLEPQQLKRAFMHPDLGEVALEKSLALYSWHGLHHLAHIESLKKRMSW